MITEKLQNAINEQITAELWSANLYLAMSFYYNHWKSDYQVKRSDSLQKVGLGLGLSKGVNRNNSTLSFGKYEGMGIEIIVAIAE